MIPRKQIGNAGPIGVTASHNHTQFLGAMIVALGVAALLGWSYTDGYLVRVVTDMGGNFTLIFGLLLAVGIFKGVIDSWWLSGAINGIKGVGADTGRLAGLFKLKKISVAAREVVKDEMQRRLGFRLYVLSLIASVALGFGFLGTLVGIADGALMAFRDIQITPEAIGERMPQFFAGVLVALQTSVAGFWVWLLVTLMRLNVLSGVHTFQSRLDRIFLEVMEEGN